MLQRKTLGKGACFVCKSEVDFREDKNGLPYWKCPKPPFGCGLEAFSRSEDGSGAIIRNSLEKPKSGKGKTFSVKVPS